jgi:hypothetical protein
LFEVHLIQEEHDGLLFYLLQNCSTEELPGLHDPVLVSQRMEGPNSVIKLLHVAEQFLDCASAYLFEFSEGDVSEVVHFVEREVDFVEGDEGVVLQHLGYGFGSLLGEHLLGGEQGDFAGGRVGGKEGVECLLRGRLQPGVK